MANVNVGRRSKAQDADALNALIEAETSMEGREVIVEKDGAKYIKEKGVFGLTVLTRIA